MIVPTLFGRGRRGARLARPTLTALSLAAGLGIPATLQARETVTYGYDAKGRLTRVAHSGSANDGLVSTYAFDAADNRARRTIIGASASRLIVVPLNGLQVIIPRPDI